METPATLYKISAAPDSLWDSNTYGAGYVAGMTLALDTPENLEAPVTTHLLLHVQISPWTDGVRGVVDGFLDALSES